MDEIKYIRNSLLKYATGLGALILSIIPIAFGRAFARYVGLIFFVEMLSIIVAGFLFYRLLPQNRKWLYAILCIPVGFIIPLAFFSFRSGQNVGDLAFELIIVAAISLYIIVKPNIYSFLCAILYEILGIAANFYKLGQMAGSESPVQGLISSIVIRSFGVIIGTVYIYQFLSKRSFINISEINPDETAALDRSVPILSYGIPQPPVKRNQYSNSKIFNIFKNKNLEFYISIIITLSLAVSILIVYLKNIDDEKRHLRAQLLVAEAEKAAAETDKMAANERAQNLAFQRQYFQSGGQAPNASDRKVSKNRNPQTNKSISTKDVENQSVSIRSANPEHSKHIDSKVNIDPNKCIDEASRLEGGLIKGKCVVPAAILAMPKREILEQYFPKEAEGIDADGTVSLTCRVSDDDKPESCTVDSEEPRGMGFGQAAILVARFVRIRPSIINGVRQPHQLVKFPIEFPRNRWH